MAWSSQGGGSPLNRRDSTMCITIPTSSSCMVGVKNEFVESSTTTPSSSCVEGVKLTLIRHHRHICNYTLMHIDYYTPTPQHFWVDRFHLVRLSVQSCQVNIFLMEEQCKFLLHTKIASDLKVCHDFV